MTSRSSPEFERWLAITAAILYAGAVERGDPWMIERQRKLLLKDLQKPNERLWVREPRVPAHGMDGAVPP